MHIAFEELDCQSTPLGDISLRRRTEPRAGGRIVYEIKLGDEFLMSSLFTVSETRLAELGLAAVRCDTLDVVVGGLGLGYTARAVLNDERVHSLRVFEIMVPVIDWHRRGLIPLGPELIADPRCDLVQADFFALAGSPEPSFGITTPHGPVDVILLDIDHSPDHWLHPGNAGFYTPEMFGNLAHKLRPDGVFGMWSNDRPDPAFTSFLEEVFTTASAEVVSFPNPYTGGESSSTVYLASMAPGN